MTKFEDNQSPYLTFSEQALAPSTPASGLAVFYRKTDNNWYFKDDGGTEVQVTTGGSALDHGGLTGLSDDDHPQYIKDSEFTAADTVLLGTGSGTFTELQHGFSKTTAPGTGDDNTAGWAVGSMWIDTTNDVVYIAMDVTTSAAVWQEVGAGGGSITVREADSSPSVSGVTTIVVSNGTLTDDGGGQVTLTTGGGGGTTAPGLNVYLYENFV